MEKRNKEVKAFMNELREAAQEARRPGADLKALNTQRSLSGQWLAFAKFERASGTKCKKIKSPEDKE